MDVGVEGIKVANEQRPESEKLYPGGFYKTVRCLGTCEEAPLIHGDGWWMAWMPKVANRCAVGYLGKAEDVASVVSYLVSKEAHYITGEHET